MILLSKLKISGHSMEPTLKNGQTVFVSSIPYLFLNPKIGDIVAFKREGKIFIKRINKVKENKYFLKGDNEKDSLDSRDFGWIEKKDIIGKLIFKF